MHPLPQRAGARPALSAAGLLIAGRDYRGGSAHGPTEWFNRITLRVTAERRPDVGTRQPGRV